MVVFLLCMKTPTLQRVQVEETGAKMFQRYLALENSHRRYIIPIGERLRSGLQTSRILVILHLCTITVLWMQQ